MKEHIERNLGIYDPIWVVPKEQFYTVIEGNTLAFIYEELSEKYANDEKWKIIDAYVLPHKVDRNVIINQSIIVYTLRIKSLLPSLYEREEFPSLAKRG